VLFRSAGFYSKIGRLEEARATLVRAQLIEPEDTDLALSMIALDIKAGDYSKSANALAILSDSGPTQSEKADIILYQLKISRRLGHTSRIIELLEAHYEVNLEIQNPLQANIIYTMMLPAISAGGEPQIALERMAEIKALIPQPYNDLAGVGEAWALADLGRVAEATAKLAAAVAVIDMLKFETFRSSVALVEGMITEADGDLTGAAALYQQAVDTAMGGRSTYLIHLAHVQRLLGEEEAAQATLNAGLLIDPSHPRFQLEMAHLLYTQGEATQAQVYLDRALDAWAEAGDLYKPAQEARQLADLLTTP